MTESDPRLGPEYKGSISEGTMNSRHLVPRFTAVLCSVWPNHPLCEEWRVTWAAVEVIGQFTKDPATDVADLLGFWECEQMGYFTESLFDAMNDIAPEGTYFGSAEGDGASYGFWDLDEDEIEEDTSE